MSIENRLDQLHASARKITALKWLTLATRWLLAVGFILPGAKKVAGEPFTLLGPETTVGYFFDAFFQAHEFYMFVGVIQVLAGLFLLVPRTATLGAVLYFPVILNIFVITLSMHFRGTWMIAGMMTLGCLYLLCWDYDRLKGILPFRTRTASP